MAAAAAARGVAVYARHFKGRWWRRTYVLKSVALFLYSNTWQKTAMNNPRRISKGLVCFCFFFIYCSPPVLQQQRAAASSNCCGHWRWETNQLQRDVHSFLNSALCSPFHLLLSRRRRRSSFVVRRSCAVAYRHFNEITNKRDKRGLEMVFFFFIIALVVPWDDDDDEVKQLKKTLWLLETTRSSLGCCCWCASK